jgi:uncharacterized protein YndB with AHSA1/START domain
VDKENKTITVRREFNAELPLVWDAYTKPELLDQWWAPLPYKNETKTMDFREGGKWHYSMLSPEGQRHYCLLFYLKINELRNFEAKDSFGDENGNLNNDFPSMSWNTRFAENRDKTNIHITILFNSLEDLEAIIKMGFKEGFTMGLNQLDTLLFNLKK